LAQAIFPEPYNPSIVTATVLTAVFGMGTGAYSVALTPSNNNLAIVVGICQVILHNKRIISIWIVIFSER